MPLQIPQEQDVVRQTQAYVRSELPDLDPSTEKAGFITGIVVAIAKALTHWYLALKDFADRQVHPQTATGKALFNGWWTALTGLQRHPITPATGYANIQGLVGSIIPIDANFTSGNRTYDVQNSATVLTQTVRASSLTFLNGLAVFETSSAHQLATGQTVSITGALDSAYNGPFTITATATNEFTYTPLTDPTIAAGEDALVSCDFARLFVKAGVPGQVSNVDGGELLIQDVIDDVESSAFVTFGGITGGTDLEDPEDFRERLLEALGSTLGMFTAEEVRDEIKNVPGVTRVWIRKAQLTPETGWPGEGQTKVIFMRDNDANPIPSAQEVNDVKDALINSILPTHMVEDNLFIIGPSAKYVDVHFASITPDTASMRLAITAQLQQFFSEADFVASDFPKIAHRDLSMLDIQCAIKETVDLETGERMQDFELTTPAADVAIDPDEIPLLGQVIFA